MDYLMALRLIFFIILSFSIVYVCGKICDNNLQVKNTPDEVGGKADITWDMLYNAMKNSDGSEIHRPGNLLKEIPLKYVRLDPDSKHGQAQQITLEYLLMLDVDDLVWNFRKTAGLPTPGNPYKSPTPPQPNTLPTSWEDPASELRGHFVGKNNYVLHPTTLAFVVFHNIPPMHCRTSWEDPTFGLRGHFVGHYLSATAQMWASTYNDTLYQRINQLVGALYECQQKIGTGYLSAFPSEAFDRLEALHGVLAPYYTIHKIMAGLIDQHLIARHPQALEMVIGMADYFANRMLNVIRTNSIERHWEILNEEFGGLNDAYYTLYGITGNRKYLVIGHLFDKPCFLGPIALQDDSISDLHVNTHIPIVIGAQKGYEVTGNPLLKSIGTSFMDMINSSHTYATGGTSNWEHWSNPKRLATALGSQTEETCTTYNMLKVSRNLFRWTKEVTHVDYYERALTNGILSIQRGKEPGVTIYFLPLKRGGSKAHSQFGWGTQFSRFWCCYGTAIESFSKLGDSIYFEDGNQTELYIVQFISSTLDWKSGEIQLNQQVQPIVSWDPFLYVKLSILTKQGAEKSSTINLRIPHWSNSYAKATLNGQALQLPAAGNFLSITKKWQFGDELTLQLPLTLTTEAIKDDRPEYASTQAILYGPYVLAGLSEDLPGLSDDYWELKIRKDGSISDLFTAIPPTYNSHLISLSQFSGNATFVLTNMNNSIAMQKLPEMGTNIAVHATFRLVPKDGYSKNGNSTSLSSAVEAIGKSFMLEPFDLPGFVVEKQGPNGELGVQDVKNGPNSNNVFKLIAGLDGSNNTVSLELESQPGCFVFNGVNATSTTGGSVVVLSCKSQNGSTDIGFQRASSFSMTKGFSEYHPISFMARGSTRNFLMMPLLGLRDESYTVYFNVTST